MPIEPFSQVTGYVAAIRSSNIDTDVIMPKIFLKGIDRRGLDRGVFHDLRFRSNGEPNHEFVLNQRPWTDARFLAAGENFGCGSSREHAVWGLLQLGFRAIVAPSFAGIFFDNCARNGLLAIEADEHTVETLMRLAASGCQITIDLRRQLIIVPEEEIRFEIGQRRKHMLLNGLDMVGLTLQNQDKIAMFERRYLTDRPWIQRTVETFE